ncbi:MAG: filamentous hemagglutinin N-terminal domain-containing protein, partial [Synergistaceae bacterium]|nr:filamentous hemagglutinin N-terminal domain-containing protein [Synergistaceae bacterium]
MKIKKRLALAFVGIWAFGMSSTACALPVLDTKDAAVRINTSGQVMNIGSSAVNNVVKWVDFSIAGGETVAFDKNNYLNYVTGHAASEIFGTLTGGGNIFIINPHGILIGHDANVNVGNLYLSTQILSDAQLDAFRGCGTSPILDASNAKGNVVNLGHLEAKTVVVEGNVIKFKNVAEVDAPTINVFAKTETRVGCDGETLPEGWRFFRAGTEGQVAPLKFKLINDEADLQKIMVNDANGRYMLAGNIKVNNDFTAIGTSSQAYGRFLGHFDGLGYEITFTKKIKANGKTSGLFGAIGEGSVVENVGVITSALEFSSTGSFNDVFVGGVVGDNRKGTIQNVWHSGNIHVDYSCNYLYVGGIVGCNTSGTLMSAYNTGKVFASGAEAPGVAYVGGIAGYQQNEDGAAKPLVENAFNSGMVTAEGP